MSFSLEHWKNPRHAIATRFEHNDIAYATQGALLAIKVFEMLRLDLASARSATILDYGCGTGRVSRPLSSLFKTVIGFDPTPECLELAAKECLGLDFPNLSYTNDPKGQFDFVCAINVFEHLNAEQEMIAFSSVIKHLKPHGKALIWYHCGKNQTLAEYFGRPAEGVNIGLYMKGE